MLLCPQAHPVAQYAGVYCRPQKQCRVKCAEMLGLSILQQLYGKCGSYGLGGGGIYVA